MIEDVPSIASVSKTEMVPLQMADQIFGIFPGLVKMTEVANVTRGDTFSLEGTFEGEGVGPSRHNPPSSLVFTSTSERISASRLTPFANIFPNKYIAPPSAPSFLHCCCNRARLPSYSNG